MELYSQQQEFLTSADLREIAEITLKKKMIVPSESFSPAEAFAGFAKSINAYQGNGSLPQILEAIRPLGPLEMPVSQPGISHVTLKDVYELARKANDYIQRIGSLPSFLLVGNSQIGTGSLFALFSAVYLDLNLEKSRSDYEVPSFDAYPKTNEQDIIRRIEDFKSWPVHRRDLDMKNIIEITKLQLWTLKPAHKKS